MQSVCELVSAGCSSISLEQHKMLSSIVCLMHLHVLPSLHPVSVALSVEYEVGYMHECACLGLLDLSFTCLVAVGTEPSNQACTGYA